MGTAEMFQVAMALLPLVRTGVAEFVTWIQSLRTTLQQMAEWTPEMESQYRTNLWLKTGDPAYQPDAVEGTPLPSPLPA
jgi:hypothetical protein